MTVTRADVSTRSRHGRVLLIGGGAGLAESLDASLPASLENVETLYDVIGEIATSTARTPVEVVVMSARIAGRLSEATMRAMRRIDPSVRFVLVQEDGDPGRTPRELFDACLRSRHDTAPLEALLADANGQTTEAAGPDASGGPSPPRRDVDPAAAPTDHPGEAAPPERAAAARPAEQQRPPAPAPRPLEAEPERNTERESGRHAPPPPRDKSAPASSAPSPTPPPASAPAMFIDDPAELIEPCADRPARPTDEPLGDTDLVDALLADPEGVRPTALRLITQQTGWNDLQWLEHPPAGTALSDATAVRVENGDRTFGGLRSGGAAAQELRPWAQWLARWLTLDARYREYRLLAFRDDLTGAWNRRYFDAFLNRAIERAHARRRPITVMVFDLDDFKVYNDRFGHAAGDEILRETVRLLASVIRREDRVCRIGGDEFAVIFADVEGPRAAGSAHPESVEQIAQRFQNEICQMHFPKLGIEAPGTLSISAGLATYPWDGGDAPALLRHADVLALESKRKGKNVLTFGPGASAFCRGRKPEA